MKTLIGLLLTALSFFAFSATDVGEYKWPSVAPFKQTFHLRGTGAGVEPKADLYLKDTFGKPIYRLLCHSGDYDGTGDLQYKNENHDFSGAFDCHLHALYSGWEEFGSLLPYDAADRTDTLSRARLFGDDVVGKCAGYPEYGAIRRFRLRGMEIVFRYSDVLFSQSRDERGVAKIDSFQFEVEVKSDPSAFSSLANQVDVDSPRIAPSGSFDCAEVVRRHVPGVSDADYLKEHRLQPPYPEIQAIEGTAVIASGGKENAAQFNLSIKNVAGQLAYLLRCTIGGHWGIDCGLFVPGKKVNLLEDSVDPYSDLSRSKILPEQLYNQCASYPEWGAQRVFKLRHLVITIEFTNPALSGGPGKEHLASPWDVDSVNKVAVRAKVEPDPMASSPVAPPPEFAYWGFLSRTPDCQTPISAAH